MVRGYVQRADIGKSGTRRFFRLVCATLRLEIGPNIRFIKSRIRRIRHSKLETIAIFPHISVHQLKAIHESTHPARMYSEMAAEIRAELADTDLTPVKNNEVLRG